MQNGGLKNNNRYETNNATEVLLFYALCLSRAQSKPLAVHEAQGHDGPGQGHKQVKGLSKAHLRLFNAFNMSEAHNSSYFLCGVKASQVVVFSANRQIAEIMKPWGFEEILQGRSGIEDGCIDGFTLLQKVLLLAMLESFWTARPAE